MDITETRDPSSVSKMARTIWMEYFPDIVGRETTEYLFEMIQSEEAISHQMDNGSSYFIMNDGGNDVGYLSVRPDDDSLFMSKLYLFKEYRGRGFASIAFDFIFEYGRSLGKKKVYLKVNKDNSNSIAVYKAKGFSIEGAETIDVGQGFRMDDYIMERAL